MLIYNYKKEFLGIDESDLKALGLSNLAELRNKSSDFADLFVKIPGHVHNFKHVHWIDFVTCAESSENSKVIIHIDNKNYTCILDIKNSYLIDEPSKKAYLVYLTNLRLLTSNENESIHSDIIEKPTPIISHEKNEIFNKTQPIRPLEEDDTVITPNVTYDPYENKDTQTTNKTNLNIIEDVYEDAPIDLDDDLLNEDEEIIIKQNNELQEIKIKDTKIEENIDLKEEKPSPSIKPIIKPKLSTKTLEGYENYIYDPTLASQELGLPIDLIEEFIQDFINQSNEFKDQLFQAEATKNLDQVKILSHKLKGVAANLRIEDAFEALKVVNTSNDFSEIKNYIVMFYFMVDKLSKKTSTLQTSEASKDEDLNISIKDDRVEEIKIEDDKLEIPEIIDIPLDIDIEEEPSKTIKYNKDIAANEIGISKEDFDSLFKDYLNECDNICGELYSAIKKNDSSLWKKLALRIQGMSNNMRNRNFTSELKSIIDTKDSKIAKEATDIIMTKLQQIRG